MLSEPPPPTIQSAPLPPSSVSLPEPPDRMTGLVSALASSTLLPGLVNTRAVPVMLAVVALYNRPFCVVVANISSAEPGALLVATK